MHDLLFENQEQLSEALYSELAEELGLSQTALLQALEEGEYKVRVRARISVVVSAAESMAPRRSSSMGRVMMDPLTTKTSSWPYEKKVVRATP
jgi:ADP-ribose pyrophosphatase YjhB (NUDIX family)